MKPSKLLYFILFILLNFSSQAFAQSRLDRDDAEEIKYFQMEPLDDSLFIKIQQEVYIDPPDPKAEIVVELRDPQNQTVSIRGTLYPYLSFSPETRAKIQTYPFKINLDDQINYGSVFTRVFEKVRFGKVISPPSLTQISPTLHYVNPFIQIFGGERFGTPLKDDIGFSFGFGTPYSGPFETDLAEANFHILGFYAGFFKTVAALNEMKKENHHTSIFGTEGFQLGYVLPIGNFLQLSYMSAAAPSESQRQYFSQFNTAEYSPKITEGNYFNWEFRYPLKVMGSTRGKLYAAQYLKELHLGYTGRELSFAGSTFDFRIDAMINSDTRPNQYLIDIMAQKIFGSWAFSALGVGPSVILSHKKDGNFGAVSIFLNARFKLGTSL